MDDKVTLASLWAKKRAGERIAMLTAYDAPTARRFDEAGVDSLLVGDSAANVVLGYPNTLPVTMDEMLVLARAVARGASRAYLIGDMPFLSYQLDIPRALEQAGRFIKEAGMDAVKLEGGRDLAPTIAAMTRTGIPVVAHLGLTPQSAALLGGYRVRGREAEQALEIYRDAVAVEAAGAVMLVLECVPSPVARAVSRRLRIPVIGIGAGPDVDGQVLVGHDALGWNLGHTARFVRRFADLDGAVRQGAQAYAEAVHTGAYPAETESYSMDAAQADAFAALLQKDNDHADL